MQVHCEGELHSIVFPQGRTFFTIIFQKLLSVFHSSELLQKTDLNLKSRYLHIMLLLFISYGKKIIMSLTAEDIYCDLSVAEMDFKTELCSIHSFERLLVFYCHCL